MKLSSAGDGRGSQGREKLENAQTNTFLTKVEEMEKEGS